MLLGQAPLFASYMEVLEGLGVKAVINLCDEFKGPTRTYRRNGVSLLWLRTVDHLEPTVEVGDRPHTHRRCTACTHHTTRAHTGPPPGDAHSVQLHRAPPQARLGRVHTLQVGSRAQRGGGDGVVDAPPEDGRDGRAEAAAQRAQGAKAKPMRPGCGLMHPGCGLMHPGCALVYPRCAPSSTSRRTSSSSTVSALAAVAGAGAATTTSSAAGPCHMRRRLLKTGGGVSHVLWVRTCTAAWEVGKAGLAPFMIVRGPSRRALRLGTTRSSRLSWRHSRTSRSRRCLTLTASSNALTGAPNLSRARA